MLKNKIIDMPITTLDIYNLFKKYLHQIKLSQMGGIKTPCLTTVIIS
jgi:hypothetical protein